MTLIPRPRYDGVRRLADMILDAIFGQPLRHLQNFFRNREPRRAWREVATRTRGERIRDRGYLRDFDNFVFGAVDRARQSPRAFTDNLRWLAGVYPEGARRYTARMGAGELNRLVDPRQPGNLSLLMQAAPDYTTALSKQVADSWGVGTYDDDHFKYLVDQGRVKRKAPFASGSQHEALDDYLKRMNIFGNRRDPLN